SIIIVLAAVYFFSRMFWTGEESSQAVEPIVVVQQEVGPPMVKPDSAQNPAPAAKAAVAKPAGNAPAALAGTGLQKPEPLAASPVGAATPEREDESDGKVSERAKQALAHIAKLAKLEPEQANPQLKPYLEDPSDTVRATAYQMILQLQSRNITTQMTRVNGLDTTEYKKRLNDADDSIRLAIIQDVVEEIKPEYGDFINSLMNDPSPRIRKTAVAAMSKLGKDSVVPLIVNYIAAEGMDEGALNSLRTYEKASQEYLKSLLSRGEREETRLALILLGELGGESVQELMTEHLSRNGPQAYRAALILAKMGLQGQTRLIDLMETGDKEVRNLAYWGLQESMNDTVIAELEKRKLRFTAEMAQNVNLILLSASREPVLPKGLSRGEVVRLLANIPEGEVARRAELYRQLLGYFDSNYDGQVIENLGRLGEPAIPVLIAAFSDKNLSKFQNRILAILGDIPSGISAKFLLDLSSDKKFADEALAALVPMGDSLLPVLEESRLGTDKKLSLLGRVASRKAIDLALTLLKGCATGDAKRYYSICLADVAVPERFISALVRELDIEPMQQVFISELGKSGKPSYEAILMPFLGSDSEKLRSSALQSLTELSSYMSNKLISYYRQTSYEDVHGKLLDLCKNTDPDAQVLLTLAVSNTRPNVRLQAVRKLGLLEGDAVEETLLKQFAVENEDPVRKEITMAFQKKPRQRRLELYAMGLDDNAKSVKEYCRKALGAMKKTEELSSLGALLARPLPVSAKASLTEFLLQRGYEDLARNLAANMPCKDDEHRNLLLATFLKLRNGAAPALEERLNNDKTFNEASVFLKAMKMRFDKDPKTGLYIIIK
ncbi:MAG: hypothetical protein HQL31_03600, partial [Planctomycetes bacterium]|nr:hypothetical protein [Planctomycetota bacterium]